ncbi:PFL_4669 family integrating conjugative element protein [Pantoea sp.]|uniref:PFL_4669 family integrating conjugative element protein n=1 Tax=Pantoea sp. TaxID=69393 RepID=UPI0031DF2A1E
MAEEKNETDTAKAGALRSSLTIELHSHYAIRLWEGRRRQPDDLRERGRPQILSMPRVIQRAGLMSRDAEGDNPYADMALLKLENALDLATTEIQKLVDELEATLKAIPARISLTDVSSVSPLNIGVFSGTPLGYRCVWLLVGYDQLALKVFQASHYGLITGKERDEMLSNGGHLVRKVYGVAQHYRSFAVTRSDLAQKTVIANEAIKLLGEVDQDVMSGKMLSTFSPNLKKLAANSEASE